MRYSITVSVVIPCYNGERFIADALRSVVNQSFCPSEIFVIDDGSTDRSADVAENFDSSIRVIRQQNQGESSARNLGIAESNGDWIAFLDADDVWEPERLEVLIGYLRSQCSDAEVVCMHNGLYRFRSTKSKRKKLIPNSIRGELERASAIDLLSDSPVLPSAAIVNRERLGNIRFPRDIRAGEDSIFFSEVRSKGHFIRVPETLTGYRVSDQQQSNSLRHRVHCFATRYRWAESRRDLFSEADLATLQGRYAKKLAWYWKQALAFDQTDLLIEIEELIEQFEGQTPLHWPFRRQVLWSYFTIYNRVFGF